MKMKDNKINWWAVLFVVCFIVLLLYGCKTQSKAITETKKNNSEQVSNDIATSQNKALETAIQNAFEKVIFDQLLRTTEVLKNPNVKFPEVTSVTKRPDGKYNYVVKDWFRKYDTPEGSFTDHACFFFTYNRYKKALDVRNDPYRFAKEIARAGYASAPNYANSLKSVIKTVEKYMP